MLCFRFLKSIFSCILYVNPIAFPIYIYILFEHYLAMQQPTLQIKKPSLKIDYLRQVIFPVGTNITLECTGYSNTNVSRYLWNSSATFQTLFIIVTL